MLSLAPQSRFAQELYPIREEIPDDPSSYLSIENAPQSSLWVLNHMPYKRKYRTRSRPYRRSRRGKFTRKTRKSFKARVTQVLMKKSETKMYHFAEENIQLNHNIGRNAGTVLLPSMGSFTNLFNIWADIPKGTGSYNRIGDRITPRGMMLKVYMANKVDRPNTMIRLIIARVPKAINGTATTVSNVNPFETTLQLGNNGNKMLMNADKDRGIKFLYDKIFRMGDNVSGPGSADQRKERQRVVKLWIKSKKTRDIVFDSAGADQIVNNPVLCWAIPYEQYGTPETDTVASLAYEGKLYYKDL